MELEDISAAQPKAAATNKTLVLVICAVTCFFLSFLSSGLNVAIPAIGAEFKANAILANWVVTLATLTTGVFLIPAGRIADIIGIKKVFTIGLSIFIPFTFLLVFSNSIYMLLTFRFLQAIGMSALIATSIVFLTSVFPANERGKALGTNVGILYFGGSISPIICGFLTQHLGWRSIFLVALPGFLLALILVLWKVKEEWVHSRGEKYDYPGTIIYGVSLVSLMYGFSVLPETYGFILVLIGIAGTILFFKWESRVKSPVFDVSIFRNNRVFLFSNITSLISYSAVFSVAFLLSLYLQYNKGLTAGQAGLILFVQPVLQAVFSPISGRFSDKVEPRIMASAGMGFTCLGLIPFIFVTESTPMALIIAALVILGIGFGIFSSPNTNAIMSSVAPKYHGVASATSGTMRTLGMLFSMAITLVLISTLVGRVVITPEYYPAFLNCVRVAFGISTVLCFAGIFTSLSRGKMR